LAEASATTNTEGHYSFLHWGAAKKTWLRMGLVMPSNMMPVIMTNDCVVTGFTYVCYTDNSDCDIEIYKNAVLEYTWEIRNKRLAYKSDELSAVTFTAGDRISVRLVSAGKSPYYPLFTFFYRYTTHATGEGGLASM